MKSLNLQSAIPVNKQGNLSGEISSVTITDKYKEKVLFIGGVHGDEHVSKLLVYKLYEALIAKNNPLSSEYSFTFYPVANPSGSLYDSREFVNTESDDLNRLPQYNLAILRSRLEKLIQEHDIIIDIHNSVDVINCGLFTINRDYSVEIDLCERANVDILTRYSTYYTLKDYAKDLGKLSLTYEFSGMTSYGYEKNLLKAQEDILNILHQRIIQRDAIMNGYHPSVDFDKYLIHELHSPVQGTIEFNIDKEIFSKNESVAKIYYSDNSTIYLESIVAPCNLKVVAKSNMYVAKNGVVLLYQKI